VSAHEWFVAAAFVGMIYGLSFVSPAGATAIAVLVALAAFIKSGLGHKLTGVGK
jgi:hypothetical protein